MSGHAAAGPRVLVIGATGLVGRALLLRLRRDGYAVAAHARSAARARDRLGRDAEVVVAAPGSAAFAAEVDRADAIVNLAGEPVAGRRWTRARRDALERSRIDVTAAIVDALGAASPRRRVLVSASAVGYYGDRGDEPLSEASAAGAGFLASLCARWEAAAARAEGARVRVVRLRFGVVLAADGGALAPLALVTRAGLGGPVASGRQWVPWVHLDDAVEAVVRALTDDRLAGAVNVVAPVPVRQRELARALGRVLGRPAFVPTPALALRLLLGEAAQVITASQRVAPDRLLALGFGFAHPDLQGALRDLLAQDASVRIARATELPASGYLAARGARYLLAQETLVDAPVEELYAFFSRPENLCLLTPSDLAFQVRALPEALGPGARIEYTIRVGGVPAGWTTELEAWEPPARFVDVQLRGPYRGWWHEHRFMSDGGSTRMIDRVYYRPPLGLLGRIAHALFIAPMLRRIFGYRGAAIRRRFGAPRSAPAEADRAAASPAPTST